MDISLVNLFGVAVLAFLVPFVLGFFPRLRIPSAVMELIGGIIIGPAVLGWVYPGPVVNTMSTIGVAFLLFLAGLELDLSALGGLPLRLGTIGFLLSFVAAFAATALLGAYGLILSPALVAIALCATSVGIIVPVLRDTGQLDSPTGRVTIAGGSVAEVTTIALLGIFYAGPEANAIVGALLFAAVVLSLALLLVLLRRVWYWEPGRRILDRLSETSAQLRVRFAMMVMLGAAILAVAFSFEAILGTFLAGAVVGLVIKGDRFEKQLRSKLESIGFGFFVPTFFITSGLKFDLAGMFSIDELGRITLFITVMLLSRGFLALLYRSHLGTRQSLAAGLLQATNLSFIVVAVEVGQELGRLSEVNATALIVAGLLSAVIFPAAAQGVLGGATKDSEKTSAQSGELLEERL